MRPLDCKVNCVSHYEIRRVERSVPLPACVGPLPQSLHHACQKGCVLFKFGLLTRFYLEIEGKSLKGFWQRHAHFLSIHLE